MRHVRALAQAAHQQREDVQVAPQQLAVDQVVHVRATTRSRRSKEWVVQADVQNVRIVQNAPSALSVPHATQKQLTLRRALAVHVRAVHAQVVHVQAVHARTLA